MSTLEEWIADLGHAADVVLDEGEKVVSKGSLNIKNDWRRRWSGISRHAPRTYLSVTYDLHRAGGTISGEIGPDKDLEGLQAPLGAILEFGALKQNTAPHPGGSPALDAEEPRFTSAVEDLGENLLAER